MFSSILRHPGVGSVAFLLRICEPVILVVCSLLAYQIRVGFSFPPAPAPLVLTGLATLMYMGGAAILRLNDAPTLRNLLTSLPRLFATLASTFAALLILLFLLKISAQFSRVWLALWFAFAVVGMTSLRWWAKAFITTRMQQGRWLRKVAILGNNAKATELIKLINLTSTHELKLMGLYSMNGKANDTHLHGTDVLNGGNFETLLKHGKMGIFDDLIVTEDLEHLKATETVLNKLHMLSINVFYCLPISLIGRVSLDGLPLVVIFKKPLEGHSIWVKRALDIVASGAILALFSPVMAVAALLVKFSSPGPVFFRQQRGGFNGQEFEMLKFRSMKVGASAMKDENGKEMQAMKHDPRVTWIGRILRKSSLDELPQLINVLKGDMSLVGPRPHVPSHNSYYETLIDSYASRHKMKPGLTGWAQLNGWRGETETLEKMVKRVEYDIWYTENWSFWLDIKIIFLTPFVTVFQRGAY